MNSPRIVPREECLDARKALMTKEKELTRLRDRLAAERRALPWVKIEKEYVFEAPHGKVNSLADWVRPKNIYDEGGMVEGSGRYHQAACACAVHQSATV